MTETELELEVNTYRNEIHASFFLSEPQLDLCCQGYRDGLKKREARIQELEEELKKEKELNMEIKNRFVKCNMCTDEMKDKCIMFSENLCEGERCEELIDLVQLVNKGFERK